MVYLGKACLSTISQAEQYGCVNGGAIHVIASILAGSEVEADSLTAPIGSVKRKFEYAEAKTKSIEKWAKAVGCWLDDTDYSLSHLLGLQIAEGGEAHVFDNGRSVVKSIGLDYYISPELALDRISLHNAYFPQTAMHVLGFGRNINGDFQIVVEQPFIQGEKMTDNEIRTYTEKLGFNLINPSNWTYATSRIYLSDMHDENVIRSVKGNVFVIDCDIRINIPELRAGGTERLLHNVKIYDN